MISTFSSSPYLHQFWDHGEAETDGTRVYNRSVPPHSGQQAEERKGPGTRHNLQSHTPSDLLPLPSPHLLKFPPQHQSTAGGSGHT